MELAEDLGMIDSRDYGVTVAQLTFNQSSQGSSPCGPTILKHKKIHQCDVCQEILTDGNKLFAHKRAHKIAATPFELLAYKQKRARLFKECNYTCESCGNSEWCGKPIPLEMEHLDGNPNNNDRSNLKAICPNCHAQTDTYRGKNIGRPKCGRDKKYQHYRAKDYVDRQLD